MEDPEPSLTADPPKDWRTVPKPEGVQALPLDKRGYPVFYTVMTEPIIRMWQDGRKLEGLNIDFRVMNVGAYIRCARKRLCGVCGQPLKTQLFFIGGPMCVQNRVFGDAAMHEDCARYARQVCPFLSHATFLYHDREGDSAAFRTHDPNVLKTKPERVVLYRCRDYHLYGLGSESKPVFIVQPASAVEWYTADGHYLCRTRPDRYAQ
jgi:hypothetical protein